MSRYPFAAWVAVTALGVGMAITPTSDAAQTECLNRTACREIRVEAADLKRDMKRVRQQIKKTRGALRSFEPETDRWIAKRSELKALKKGFKALQRELKALQKDYRHQACSNC